MAKERRESSNSNDQGRAFEYIFLTTLATEIQKIRPINLEKDTCFKTVQKSWHLVSPTIQEKLRNAAEAAVPVLLGLEPLISEIDNHDVLTISSQPDSRGKIGDVRDILISRESVHWQIGLSLKHNHFAVKHSRLSAVNDFGKSWLGIECSDQYWKDIRPIFEFLSKAQKEKKEWRQLDSKEEDVYIPLLKAFIAEIQRLNAKDSNLPKKFVEYLLGKFDFYKTIAIDDKRITRIDSFNLYGTLNKNGLKTKPQYILKEVKLPTRIISFAFKPNSNNTLELCLNEGWQFTMRIHNASTKVEPSLKFDVQCVGTPASLTSIECVWRKIDEN